MGRRSSQPDPQAAAREAADRAYKEQQRLIEDIRNRATEYENKAKSQISVLEGLSGTSMKDYISQARSGFEKYMGDITSQYKPQFENYTPNILSSSSMSQLGDTLRQAGSEFREGVQAVSEEGSARLYKTLAAPIQQFSQTAMNPAFNLALDPRSMALASRPPTVRSDVDSMKQLYTYNV